MPANLSCEWIGQRIDRVEQASTRARPRRACRLHRPGSHAMTGGAGRHASRPASAARTRSTSRSPASARPPPSTMTPGSVTMVWVASATPRASTASSHTAVASGSVPTRAAMSIVASERARARRVTACDRGRRRVGLEAAALPARALVAVGIDGGVTHLAGPSRRPATHHAADDVRRRDAGAQRHEQHVVGGHPGALGERGGGDVPFERDRQPERSVHAVAHRFVAPGHVHGELRDAVDDDARARRRRPRRSTRHATRSPARSPRRSVPRARSAWAPSRAPARCRRPLRGSP